MAATCHIWKTKISVLCEVTLFKEQKLPAHISLNADRLK